MFKKIVGKQRNIYNTNLQMFAAMAELVDALGSGPSRGNPVDVRVILAAHFDTLRFLMTTIALIANGTIKDYAFIRPLVEKHATIVAVDGGLKHCHAMGIVPNLLIGDIDSVSASILEQYPSLTRKVFPIDKDLTDLELAINEVFADDVDSATLFGGLGGRADHALMNLHLLLRHRDKLTLITDREQVIAIDRKTTVAAKEGQTVSLLPLVAPCEGVTTQGLKWELTNTVLDSNFVSISNIALGDTFDIDIQKGALLCFLVHSPESP